MLLCNGKLFLTLAAHFNNFFTEIGCNWYWIGLSKQNGDWVWDNLERLTYTNWGPGEPDGCCGNDPTCVLNNVWMTRDQWNDWDCVGVTSALCEIEGSSALSIALPTDLSKQFCFQ